MEFKRFGSRYVLRIDKGEELVATLQRFCQEQEIRLGSVQGIGAANKITIGWFETATKEYHRKEFDGDFEIAPVAGNIATMGGETYLHLHITFGDDHYGAHAGHLQSAVISATCELIIDAIDGSVDRQQDEEIGLNLLTFS